MAISDEIRFILLPIFFTVLASLLGWFIKFLQDRSELRRTNRERQIEGAIAICEKIISVAETVWALMKNDAWFVAWRKAIPLEHYPEDHLSLDDQRWDQYIEALTEWRKHEITFETELKAYFGVDGPEARLYKEINEEFQELADMLWTVRFASKPGSAVFWADLAKPVAERPAEGKTTADQEKSRDKFFLLLQQTRVKITILSSTMIHCIQEMNIGTLGGREVELSEADKKSLQDAGSKAVSMRNVKANVHHAQEASA